MAGEISQGKSMDGGRVGPGKHSHVKNTQHKYLQRNLRRDGQRGSPERKEFLEASGSNWMDWHRIVLPGEKEPLEAALPGGCVVNSTVTPYPYRFLG